MMIIIIAKENYIKQISFILFYMRAFLYCFYNIMNFNSFFLLLYVEMKRILLYLHSHSQKINN